MALDIEITGSLMKLARTTLGERIVNQVQIKASDKGEINALCRELAQWGVEDIDAKVPDISKLTVPLGHYSIFLDVDFAVNPYTDEVGAAFKAKLASVTFNRKVKKVKTKNDDNPDEILVQNIFISECLLNFVKNDDPDDTRTGTFLKNKDEDENGKKVLVAYKVRMKETKPFTLGN